MNHGIKEEVVAAIAAAIAAYNEEAGTQQVLKSIRKVPKTASAWRKAGRVESMRNRLGTR